ncbi:MAG: methyltransferase domain-containing protein [Rudaea sp.]
MDLAAAFPEFPQATQGGFAGDLPLSEWLGRHHAVDVELVTQIDHTEQVLMRRSYRIAVESPAPVSRIRSFELADVVERLPNMDVWGLGSGAGAHVRWPALILGAPHFHDAGTLPTVRVLEEGPTNAYSQGSIEIIEQTPTSGVFLDLGCGIRNPQDIRANGVYLDAVHFRGVDVVNTQTRLPLRDKSIDAVVSLSVFEHLPDPFAMAAEIYRILKPGGSVWIETAFMQPLHADPSHYFNMTIEGLVRTFAGFDIQERGVQPHHFPSQSLSMQLRHVLPYLHDGQWKHTFDEWLDRLYTDGAALDDALGPIGRNTLAAGVFIRARKPATA